MSKNSDWYISQQPKRFMYDDRDIENRRITALAEAMSWHRLNSTKATESEIKAFEAGYNEAWIKLWSILKTSRRP